MLKIRKLQVEDFGPYKGSQEIVFPEEDGVSIIYGENMRGKTMLLNAIRYAFFEKVVYRGAKEVSLHQIGNWESAREGKYGFKVILSFDFKDHEYELTRQFTQKDPQNIPESNVDYQNETLLRKDGDVLGPDITKIELNTIMPEKIARFFLFDGELLQQYEQLLSDESEMGPQIKDAIERILGVPILTNSRADITALYQKAQKEESSAAKRDHRTEQIGKLLETQAEKRKHHEDEANRLQQKLDGFRIQKTNLEDALAQTHNIRIFMEERERVKGEIGEIGERISEQKSKIQELMNASWLGIIQTKILSIREEYEQQLAQYREELAKQSLALELKKMIKTGLSAKECPICQRELDKDSAEHIKGELKKIEKENNTEVSSEELDKILNVLSALNQYSNEDKTDLLIEVLESIDELEVERATKLDRRRELKDLTKDHDEREIRDAGLLYEQVIREINIVEEGVSAERTAAKEAGEQIEKLEKKLGSMGIAGFEKEQLKRELCHELLQLFEDGVDIYRKRLKEKVQDDASEIFLLLTTEPDYAGLQINENYGLVIVHDDGELIPVRSAGAEHVVALSLIGALQRNAPLRGPIVMDSPFARLDEGHTKNVISSIPHLAHQVIVLVYKSELKPEVARNELLTNLKAEYHLVRMSARHTALEGMEN